MTCAHVLHIPCIYDTCTAYSTNCVCTHTYYVPSIRSTNYKFADNATKPNTTPQRVIRTPVSALDLDHKSISTGPFSKACNGFRNAISHPSSVHSAVEPASFLMRDNPVCHVWHVCAGSLHAMTTRAKPPH